MLGVGSLFAPPARYRVGERIGRGGFGTVHRGWTNAPGGFSKPVAIKMVHVEAGEDMERRLRDEARLLGLIRHRAIVTVDDLVVIDGRWCLVMEYVDGVDLSALIARGPIPPRVAFEIAAEIAAALAAARGAVDRGTNEPLDLIHRDIKPANLRITPHGGVKVLDFGIARAAFAGRESQTRTLSFGSPGYLAPERLDGVDSPAGDVFALGVVLAECLLGRAIGPLSVDRRRHAEAVAALVAELPAGAELVADALAYDREERPTAEALATRLRQAAATREGPWLAEWAPLAIPEALLRPTPPLLTTMTVAPARRARRPRGMATYALLGLAGIALAATAALLLTMGDREPAAPVAVSAEAGTPVATPTDAFPTHAPPTDAPPTDAPPPAEVSSTAAPPEGATPPAAAHAAVSSTAAPPAASSTSAMPGASSNAATPTAVPPTAATPTAATPTAATPAASPPALPPDPAPASTAAAGRRHPAELAAVLPDASPPSPDPASAAPVEAPADPAASEPAPTTLAPAPPATGAVVVEGEVDEVRLVGADGRVMAPGGAVPAGTWRVEARFGEAIVHVATPLEVIPGGSAGIRCSAAVQNCRVTP